MNPHLGFKCVVFLTVSGLSEGLDVLNVVTVSKDRTFPAAMGLAGGADLQAGPERQFRSTRCVLVAEWWLVS